jgi:hypothetical protein
MLLEVIISLRLYAGLCSSLASAHQVSEPSKSEPKSAAAWPVVLAAPQQLEWLALVRRSQWCHGCPADALLQGPAGDSRPDAPAAGVASDGLLKNEFIDAEGAGIPFFPSQLYLLGWSKAMPTDLVESREIPI